MAERLVTDLIKQLALITTREVRQKIKLVKNADKEIRKLEGNLRTVFALLNDAEKKQATEEAVKLWLKEFEHVCYKMDDVLDEWNTAMIKFEIQKHEEQNAVKDKKKKKKVFFSIPSPSRCFRPVNKVIIRKDIADKIIVLDRELNEIVKLRKDYNFVLSTGNATEVVAPPNIVDTSPVVDVSTIFGRDEDGNKLLRILLGNDSEVESVISLVGIDGIGKTALAQLAYNHPGVVNHFQERIWVSVSEPFDQCKVAKAIFEALGGRDPDINELESLLNGIHKLVKGKKFFLVLDDVCNIVPEMWDPLKFALIKGEKDSRILVTTREVIVAQKMNSTSECMIHLKGFSDEDCWLMLSKIAFLESDREQREELKDLGMQIAKKCNGFPLVAKTLGTLMHYERSKEHWEKVLHKDLCELGLFKPLLLSYNNLSSPLKQCFSFCAIFPKDYVISVDEMIYMWLANGYIDSEENMEMANLATKYFDDLAIFFRDFEKDKDNMLTSCKMHDIVHEFARSITKNECITIDSDEVSNYANARHLRLEIPGEAQFPESIYTAKNLRTLILEVERDYDLSRLFKEFSSLRALTLKCQSKKLLNDLGNCIHLRFLNLYDYGAYELPETICDLCNLQILKIYSSQHFGLKKLPQGMGKLIKLRYLILDRELEFPSGIGRLTSLRRLSHFSICDKDDSKGCKLGELKKLNNLQGTLQIGGLGNALDEREAKNAQLREKKGLRTLRLLFYGENDKRRENDASILNALESPQNLEYLSIERYLGTKISPKWTMSLSLTKLKTLQLLYCIDLEHLPSLGKLPFLESLSIWNANNLKKVGDEFLGIDPKNKKDSVIKIFPYLKSLEFHNLFEWEEWIGNGRMRGGEEEEDCIEEIPITYSIMPQLKQLAIFHCGKLKSLPAFLCTTTSLEKLDIELSPILSKHCQREIGENWSKISHIPNIQINQKYVQRDGEEVNE